jgi:hypothetical protein
MRYLFDVFTYASGALDGLSMHHSSLTVENVSYVENHFVKDVPTVLRNGNSTGPVFIQAGAWDLASHSGETFLTSFTASVLPFLITYRGTARWMSTPPVPSKFYPLVGGGFWLHNTYTRFGVQRNNFAITACNAVIRGALARHDIGYIPVFELSFPWYEFSSCDIHYICRWGSNGAPKVSIAGRLVLDQVVEHVCSSSS